MTQGGPSGAVFGLWVGLAGRSFLVGGGGDIEALSFRYSLSGGATGPFQPDLPLRAGPPPIGQEKDT